MKKERVFVYRYLCVDGKASEKSNTCRPKWIDSRQHGALSVGPTGYNKIWCFLSFDLPLLHQHQRCC